MAILKVKRNTTNSTVPSGLSAGELAYVQQTNKLYIGNQVTNSNWSTTALHIASTDSDSGTTINTSFNASYSPTVSENTATHTTNDSKFGSSSLYFGSEDAMIISGVPSFGTGHTSGWMPARDVTFECWIKINPSGMPAGVRNHLISGYSNHQDEGFVAIQHNGSDTCSVGFAHRWHGEPGGWEPANELMDGGWHHFAIVGEQVAWGMTYFYLDGVFKGSNSNSQFQLGNFVLGEKGGYGTTSAHWGHYDPAETGVSCWMEEIRYSDEKLYPYNSYSAGDQAFDPPTEPFPAGETVINSSEIKPEFLTYATDASADKIVIKDADGSNSYSLTTGVLAGDISYTLPDDAPNSSKVLASNASGELSYTTVSIDNLATIGDVENTPQDNELLIWDSTANSGSGGWIGKAPSDMLGDLQVDSSSDQTYENLVLNGNLTVKGDSVQLNSSNLAIRDKSLGVGVSGTSEVGTATMDTGVVSITTSNSFSNGDSVFVGDAPNIPTGYYTLADNVKILLQGGSADVSNNTYTLDGAFGQTPTISTGTGPFSGDTYSFNNTSARSFGVNQDDPFGAVSGDLKTGSDDLTIECWIKRANTNSGTDYIWTLASSSAWEFMGFRFNNANTLYTYCKILGGGASSSSGQKDFSITNNAFDDTSSWHHLVYERYGDTLTVYWDGASVGTADLTGHHWWDDSSAGYNGATIASSRMVLGIKYGYNSDHHFDGEITQLRATINNAVYKGAFSVPTGAFSAGGGYTFTVPNSTATESTPFDVSIALPSTDAQVDGSGLIFPGTTEKSLKWNDTNDNFELTGGDLRISGDEFHLNGTKVIDNSTKKISGVNVDASQVTGSFDGGTYS